MSAPDAGASITDVTGGVAGLAAAYDGVRALADAFDAAGSALRDWSELDGRTLVDSDLLASAPLAPLTFAEAEAAVIAATTGPDGLLPASLGWEADALLVRTAILGLEESDQLARAAVDELDRRLGLATGLTLRAVGPVLLPLAIVAANRLSPATRVRLAGVVDRWLAHHPGLVQHAVNGGGGLLSGLAGVPLLARRPRDAARLLALGYDDGAPVVRPRDDLRVPSGRVPPRSVAGLIGHLGEVAHLSPDPGSPDNGTIEVQTLAAGTDRVRHVVYLPGTDDLTTLPWTQDDDIRDLGTCLRSDGDLPTSYQRGILAAMHQAGIGAHDPVLLVGHSLGGMEAAALASRDTGFHITDVVTAGSPTAQLGGFPDGTHVLSLEGRGDPVPLLDGSDNPDSVEQVTVRFDDHPSGALDAHTYPHYLAGAAAVDAATDPSVVERVAGLRDRGFLLSDGSRSPTVDTRVFQVLRGG